MSWAPFGSHVGFWNLRLWMDLQNLDYMTKIWIVLFGSLDTGFYEFWFIHPIYALGIFFYFCHKTQHNFAPIHMMTWSRTWYTSAQNYSQRHTNIQTSQVFTNCKAQSIEKFTTSVVQFSFWVAECSLLRKRNASGPLRHLVSRSPPALRRRRTRWCLGPAAW